MGSTLIRSRHESCGHTIFYISSIVVLVTALIQGGTGCFPVQDVFKESCLWIQTTSMQSRNRIYVCSEHRGIEPGAPMTIESEGIVPHAEPPRTLTCLRGYGDHRYKVKVTNSRKDVIGYQCLKFSPLTSLVVRMEMTNVQKEDKLDCARVPYTTDEAVLIADYQDLKPKPCPLSGGFQLLMGLGESPSNDGCMNSIWSYHPQLLFECDLTSSSRAIIDLGKWCTPDTLWNSQSLRGRYVAHLKCLSSWQENRGQGSKEFTTILLGMRDSYRSYWCLHLQRVTGRTSHQEVAYKALLTLDGRCLSDISGTWDAPQNTDIYGKLVSFTPRNDTKCEDKTYIRDVCDSEGSDVATCSESLRCPSNCGRCKEELKFKDCAFPEATRGSWDYFIFTDTPSISIGKDTVKSSQFGQFRCREPVEKGPVRDLYALVQTGVKSTCWPYYSCAQIVSLAPGLLSFQMRPALRNKYTGQLETCQATHLDAWFIRPEKTEEAKTLLDKKRLKPTPCEFPHPQAFPTRGLVPGCQLLIPRCTGSCNSFNSSLEAGSCNNMTASNAGLYIQHECMARFQFTEYKQVVFTKVLDLDADQEVYLCWLFTDNRLYILPAYKCNQDQINSAFEFDDQPEFTYDPFIQLVKSMSQSASRGGMIVLVARPHLMVSGLVLSWLLVFVLGVKSA